MAAASLLTHETVLLRAAAAELLLDRVGCGDVRQYLAGDRNGAGNREFVEVAQHVHPAECEFDLAAIGKLWVGVATIDLQNAPNSRSALRGASRRLFRADRDRPRACHRQHRPRAGQSCYSLDQDRAPVL